MSSIPVVVEQHAEEAAFLWLLRDSAVHDPHYYLYDLAHLDDRTEAHIDGLRIAGDEGWEICKEVRSFSQVPIIVLSALNDPSMVASVLDAGADDYLTKPTPSRILVAHINRLTRRNGSSSAVSATTNSLTGPARPLTAT